MRFLSVGQNRLKSLSFDVSRSIKRSRGTGPRATVSGGVLGSRTAPFPVGRGPVPRHASVYQTFAGDRPPRYGNRTVSRQQNGPLPRRARACPSPCFDLPDIRGGQAPALRYREGFLHVRGGQAPALRYNRQLAPKQTCADDSRGKRHRAVSGR